MITKPPPYDSAPTFSAVHATAARVPAARLGNRVTESPARGTARGRRTAASTSPAASSTSTSQGPRRAAAAAPAATYPPQRNLPARESPVRRQLGGVRLRPACTATA